MFEFDWAIGSPSTIQCSDNCRSSISPKEIRRTLWTVWREHCVECAVPECFSTCSLYRERKDGRCQRFKYGIRRHPQFRGRYRFGADIVFRRWGKLETNLSPALGSMTGPNWNLAESVYFLLPDKLRSLVRAARNRLSGTRQPVFDDFVVECYSHDDRPFALILEFFTSSDGKERTPRYRTSFEIKPGMNLHRLPAEHFGMTSFEGYVYLTPEDDQQHHHITFTWLDFVTYLKRPKSPTTAKPAPYVKCVAWDLDNTLWNGVLIESDAVQVRPEALELIKWFDERGIVQSIISKNDHDQAIARLKQAEIDHYFLHPAINWGPKSESLKGIASELNLGIDAFAVIDDSPFERAEISNELPMVRVFEETKLTELRRRPEFDVPITIESRRRREMYQTNSIRKKAEDSFGGPSADFLRRCQLELTLFVPSTESEWTRCHELLLRSNQLNLSGNRYTRSELNELTSQPSIVPIGLRCRDRFGDYGIVGFTTWRMDIGYMTLVDLVISCRVAQKGIELAYFSTIASLADIDLLLACYQASNRNGPLMNALSTVGFVPNNDDTLVVESSKLGTQDIVSVESTSELRTMFKNIRTNGAPH